MIFKMQTMQRRWYQHLSYAAMGAGSGERGFLRFIESWERGQIFDKHRRCGFDVDSMYVLDVWWCFGCLEAEQNSKTLAVSWVLVMPVMPVMPLKLAWCGLLTARFSRPVWWKWFAWRQGWCRGNGWSYPQSTSRAFSEWLDMDPNMVRYLEVTTFHPISIDFPKLQRCFFFPQHDVARPKGASVSSIWSTAAPSNWGLRLILHPTSKCHGMGQNPGTGTQLVPQNRENNLVNGSLFPSHMVIS